MLVEMHMMHCDQSTVNIISRNYICNFVVNRYLVNLLELSSLCLRDLR
jgi:hypothetical protein